MEPHQDPEAHLRTIVLSLRFSDNGNSWKAHPVFLELFVAQFNSPPPTNFTPHGRTAPIYAILGISHAIGFSDTDHLVPGLHPAWLKMWAWMDFLYRQFILVERDQIEREILDLLAFSIENMLLIFLADASTTAIVAATGGVLGLAIDMFTSLGAHLKKSVGNVPLLPTRLKLTSTALIGLIPSPLSDFDEVVVALGSNKRVAAQALFLPVSPENHGAEDITGFFPILIDVHIKLCERSPDFYGSLSPSVVISHICDALSHFTSTRRHVPDAANKWPFKTHDCIEALLRLLIHYSLRASEEPSWIIHALRHDILSLLAACASSGDATPNITRHAEALLGDLRQHSLHLPILRRISSDPALKHIPSGANSSFLSQWLLLVQGLGYLRTLRAEFDEYEPFSPHFFRLLMQREMAVHHDELMEAQKHRLPISNTPSPPPYIFLVDCMDSIPPRVTTQTVDESGIDIRQMAITRMPFVLPFIKVRYGTRIPLMLVCEAFSGAFYGWMDDGKSNV
ncbi:hypothetical protein DXG01_003944 [Tephrocybe rancida]|nr:hypothetical protein DXG01_003944 [Tephrocybe rancida]